MGQPISSETGELTLSASAFKARCLEIFKALEARKFTRVTITRRGKPVAEVMPPATEKRVPLWGAHAGSVTVTPGVDLTAPVLDEPLDVLDEHRLAGAVAPAAVPAAADEVRKDRALAALRVADDQSGAALPAEHRSFQVVLVHLRRVRR